MLVLTGCEMVSALRYTGGGLDHAAAERIESGAPFAGAGGRCEPTAARPGVAR